MRLRPPMEERPHRIHHRLQLRREHHELPKRRFFHLRIWHCAAIRQEHLSSSVAGSLPSLYVASGTQGDLSYRDGTGQFIVLYVQCDGITYHCKHCFHAKSKWVELSATWGYCWKCFSFETNKVCPLSYWPLVQA